MRLRIVLSARQIANQDTTVPANLRPPRGFQEGADFFGLSALGRSSAPEETSMAGADAGPPSRLDPEGRQKYAAQDHHEPRQVIEA